MYLISISSIDKTRPLHNEDQWPRSKWRWIMHVSRHHHVSFHCYLRFTRCCPPKKRGRYYYGSRSRKTNDFIWVFEVIGLAVMILISKDGYLEIHSWMIRRDVGGLVPFIFRTTMIMTHSDSIRHLRIKA